MLLKENKMVCTGRAKKIRRMLESQGIPDELFNQAYKNVKKAKYERKNSNVPNKPLMTKMHKRESLLEFKERRKKTNKKKRIRKKIK